MMNVLTVSKLYRKTANKLYKNTCRISTCSIPINERTLEHADRHLAFLPGERRHGAGVGE
jgi:hypothetical protein